MADPHPLAPIEDGPDADGFTGWTFPGDGFNAWLGRIATRIEDGRVRVRFETGRARANVGGTLHGGFLLGALDQALFVGSVASGQLEFGTGVTLDCATQFVAPGRIDRPLDCLVEIVRITRRLVFLRGTMEQGEGAILIWQATLAKRPAPQA